MQSRTFTVLCIFLIGSLLALPTRASDQANSPGVPGTLNYIEGQVSLGTRQLAAKDIGAAGLQPGQSLTTEAGKAELLLIPGVFFRLGSNSSVRLVSAGLVITELELDQGRAIVEVDEIHPENHLLIHEKGITIRLEKTGLYEFDLDSAPLRVFEGKATIDTGSRHFEVKSDRQLSLADNGTFTVEKFDRKLYEGDDLYQWSSLRSAYVAEANVNESSYYEELGGTPGGPFWWGSGWYWDPWFDAYTFLPENGIFFSSYGWGFYSPWCVRMSPFYGGAYWYGNRSVYRQFSANPTQWGQGTHYISAANYSRGVYSGPGSTRSAFHSGARFTGAGHGFGMSGTRGLHTASGYRGGGGFFHGGGFHSGGFHGGGGGFHGGGGGFHGGGMSIGHGR